MKKSYLALAFITSLSVSAVTHAADSSFFSTVQVGTLGPGLNIGYQFNPYFDVRANVNGLKYSRDIEVNDVKYDADLKLLTAGLLADYYPFANGFRLTAGVLTVD